MKLRVFASTRLINAFMNEARNSTATLLDKTMSVSDFIENVCFVPSQKASSYEQLLIMHEACKKSAELKEKLNISTEFFAFLKNNEYLFSFFKELALENKDIKELETSDTYALYSEHLAILDEVFKNYLALLKNANLHDDISLLKNYTLNLDFLDDFESINFELAGFLNNFEANLLKEISQHKELILSFKTSKFNIKSLQKIPFLNEFSLELDACYQLNLSKKILSKISDFKPLRNGEFVCKAFSQRLLQAVFIQDEISRFIRAGLKPENIVVITPDESFTNIISMLDFNKSLNYASGISIEKSVFFQCLKALFEAVNLDDFTYKIDENYFENKEQIFDYTNSILHFLKLDFIGFKAKFNELCEFEFFKDFITFLMQNESAELRAKLDEELLFIKDLLSKEKLKLSELMQLFFIQIKHLTQSYTGGGKVTAMGLLESRGLKFDGVIVIDFNDDLIPKRSINELFLNNYIREKSGLISHSEHENLQRFYYESLFKNAKKVSISYIQNEEKTKSRLLSELENFHFITREISESAYLNALDIYKAAKLNLTPLDLENEAKALAKCDIFAKPLSFSRLNCYLNSKLTYFYKYILNLQEARKLTPKDGAENRRLSGIILHKILEEYYTKFSKNRFDEKLFFELLNDYKNEFNALEIELLKLKFHNFGIFENEHFSKGWEVLELEKDFNENPKKILIDEREILLIGKIDRIDFNEKENEFLIIDYKSGALDEKSYQLAFYQLLFDENAKAVFYDLKETMQHKKQKEKNERNVLNLKLCLSEIMRQNFEPELKNGRYLNNDKNDSFCPYKLIYEKDLK